MQTFYDLFLEYAERWPQNVALEMQRHDRLESYTYADLRRMAESVGQWIVGGKFEAGSRLAILADNHPRWVAAYLGIIAAGCTAVPLDTALHASQVAKLLKDSGSTALFVDGKHLPVASEAVVGLSIAIVLIEKALSPDPGSDGKQEARAISQSLPDFEHIFSLGPGTFKPVQSSPEAVAGLLYTSGTTADPKGVMLTHANLMGEVAAVFNRLNIGPEDAVLGVLPMFHILAQMANLLLGQQRQRPLTYLLIVHDLAIASNLADEIAVLQNGTIVETASSADILRAPRQSYTQALVAAAFVSAAGSETDGGRL